MRRGLLAVVPLALAVAVLTAVAQKSETKAQLEKIKNVGREGAGNAEAAKAWKALVVQGTSALMPILGAMNDEEPTAGNWLRSAFDTIADKALEAKTLPADELEKFVNNTTNARGARRLAYEWLVKADAKAPDRLLPKMLLDPSHELRRDAIDVAIKEAETLVEKKDPGAKAIYQRALKGACDQDQVDIIAKALDKFGEKVDRHKHFGLITSWHLIAPFEHHKGIGWDKAYPPEKGIDLKAVYDGKGGEKVEWKPHTTTHALGKVDFNTAVSKYMGAVGYAYAVVESPEERLVEFRVGCKNGLKIFLNGKEIFAREEYHHGMRFDQFNPRGTLKKGKNEILLKVCQNEQKDAWAQEWEFLIRLSDFTGSAVPFTQPAIEKEGK